MLKLKHHPIGTPEAHRTNPSKSANDFGWKFAVHLRRGKYPETLCWICFRWLEHGSRNIYPKCFWKKWLDKTFRGSESIKKSPKKTNPNLKIQGFHSFLWWFPMKTWWFPWWSLTQRLLPTAPPAFQRLLRLLFQAGGGQSAPAPWKGGGFFFLQRFFFWKGKRRWSMGLYRWGFIHFPYLNCFGEMTCYQLDDDSKSLHIFIWGFPKMVGFHNNYWFSYKRWPALGVWNGGFPTILGNTHVSQ